MDLSPDTENVLNYLDQVSGGGLRKRNDVGTLLELAAARGAHKEMNDLIFHGRHLFNLYTTLRKSSAGAEGYRVLEREFTTAIETVRSLLAQLLIEADEEQITRFNETYYSMTQGGVRNVLDLAHDLGVFKAVQNERKYGGPADEPEEDDPGQGDL